MSDTYILTLVNGKFKFDILGFIKANLDLNLVIITNQDKNKILMNVPSNIEVIHCPDNGQMISSLSKVKQYKNVIAMNEESHKLVTKIKKYLKLEVNQYGDLRRFIDKQYMADECIKSSIPHPKTFVVNRDNLLPIVSLLEKEKYNQIIIKPTDGTRSDHVHCFSAPYNKEFILNVLGKGKNWILQEKNHSSLWHYDFLIKDGRIIWKNIGQYMYPNHIAEEKGCLGSLINPNLLNNANFLTFANSLSNGFAPWPNGCYHCEFFWNGKDKTPVFLEIAWRSAGAGVPAMYEYMSGINIQKMHLTLNINVDRIDDLPGSQNKYPYGAFIWFYGLLNRDHKVCIDNLKSSYLYKEFPVEEKQKVEKNRNPKAQLLFKSEHLETLTKDFYSFMQ